MKKPQAFCAPAAPGSKFLGTKTFDPPAPRFFKTDPDFDACGVENAVPSEEQRLCCRAATFVRAHPLPDASAARQFPMPDSAS